MSSIVKSMMMSVRGCMTLWALFVPLLLLGQSDRGTITGTVIDPAGAVVSGASVTARNTETGSERQTTTTETGNYTIPSLPAGTYDVVVEVQGFKRVVQQQVQVQVAVTSRIDVTLTLGSTTESISVTAESPLLRTENAEQSTTISGDRINSLPLNFGGGAGNIGAIRNPLAFVVLSPGVSGTAGSGARINGAPANTFRIMFEGQDSTSGNSAARVDETQPSVEAIQEYTIQTSNFAAEFGQVGGGLFNFTARSGTNQLHGSVYEYFVNEFLNAGNPFTNNGQGSLVRPRSRKHNYGGSIGGPVIIPKLYNGRDKTFFFFNLEMFRNNVGTLRAQTVPTAAMRTGDFSALLNDRVLGTDPLGRPIRENAIYDPATTRVENGQVVRDPFPNNIIPQSRLDPVALRIQSLIPQATIPGLINNFDPVAFDRKIQSIPAVKIDHSFSSLSKMSVYWSKQRTDRWSSRDGLPDPLSAWRDQQVYSHTTRINYDQSITPTLLIHAGAGYIRYFNPDSSPTSITEYDAATELGLRGGTGLGFPRLGGLNSAYGGVINTTNGFGPTQRNLYWNDKLTSVLNATWVRNNHTFKTGAEFRIDMWAVRSTLDVAGNYQFSNIQTALPSTQGQNLGGAAVGFPYASFLLGAANIASIRTPQDPQYRKNTWGIFLQDTWKITRKLTLDYGLRWDYSGAAHEIWYRNSAFSPTVANPSAGGLPGGTAYEGYGPGRCNCNFAQPYPYAIGPRIGGAYQINDKTVLRAGWGITYGHTAPFSYLGTGSIIGVGFNTLTIEAPAYGEPAALLRNGIQYDPALLTRTSLDPGIRPTPGQLNIPPPLVDNNGGRPPRINQWSIGLQREVTGNLVVEAAYVGNRGSWFNANNLVDYNATSTQRLNQFGLDIRNAADRQLLTSRIDSPLAQSRGFRAPYAGFPVASTVAQSLRPFPQFGTLNTIWAPLGKTWYDSLQVKVTKRYSHGLDLTAAFTYQKELGLGSTGNNVATAINDVFNRDNQKSLSAQSQPFIFVTAFNYQIPTFRQNRIVNTVLGGWTIGGLFRYASGLPIPVPAASNNLGALLFRNTRVNRVTGEPLFLKDPNCGCIDPNADFIYNPKAWSEPAAGEWGTAAPYYSDFRFARRPDEQLSIGKVFAIRERMSFQIRGEFFNVFNRTYVGNADTGSTSPLATAVRNQNGVPISGFGRIDARVLGGDPRNGQIVARFQF